MTWIAKTPRRFDFCGCPPCPLCFDWVDGEKRTLGMDKFISDIMGKRTPTLTVEEAQTMQKSAQAIHAANLNKDERLAEELRDADHAQHFQRQMGEALQLAKSQALRPKPLNTVVLDGKDLSYVEKDRKKQEQKKQVEEDQGSNVYLRSNLYPSSIIQQMMEAQEEQLRQAMYYGMVTPPNPFNTQTVNQSFTLEPPRLSDKERREQQAREDAKERMRQAAWKPITR